MFKEHNQNITSLYSKNFFNLLVNSPKDWFFKTVVEANPNLVNLSLDTIGSFKNRDNFPAWNMFYRLYTADNKNLISWLLTKDFFNPNFNLTQPIKHNILYYILSSDKKMKLEDKNLLVQEKNVVKAFTTDDLTALIDNKKFDATLLIKPCMYEITPLEFIKNEISSLTADNRQRTLLLSKAKMIIDTSIVQEHFINIRTELVKLKKLRDSAKHQKIIDMCNVKIKPLANQLSCYKQLQELISRQNNNSQQKIADENSCTSSMSQGI